MATINTINIVKQSPQASGGTHVDPEYTLLNGAWCRTDANRRNPVIESVQREKGETDAQFNARVDARASQLDREYGCSRCYR